VFTYDIWQTYVRKGRSDSYYLRVGRIVTVVGILIGIATAFIASGYTNIMNYIQLLFSYFNAPLFATFIIAMFWKRATPWAGVSGLAAGTLGAAVMHFAGYHIGYFYAGGDVLAHAKVNAQMVNFYGAIVAFVADAVVTVIVSLVTRPKPVEELAGLVYGVPDPNAPDPKSLPRPSWWASPKLLGGVSAGIVVVLSVIFT
jgi:solute:Na+ symporter, SSS family